MSEGKVQKRDRTIFLQLTGGNSEGKFNHREKSTDQTNYRKGSGEGARMGEVCGFCRAKCCGIEEKKSRPDDLSRETGRKGQLATA